ncbi:hypothetical protein ACSAZL_19655 [Methanosarcina sp. T3]|uniref:hypothetical protein n=1 Tax=Methanosarcina sp. T3 TaxID=3439062 RepID=UPI003F860EA4
MNFSGLDAGIDVRIQPDMEYSIPELDVIRNPGTFFVAFVIAKLNVHAALNK